MIYLSRALAQGGGTLSPDAMSLYHSAVTNLLSKPTISATEKGFIKDYAAVMAELTREAPSKPTASREVLEIQRNPKNVIKLNELVMKPEPFDGEKPRPRRWISDYEEAMIANGWSEEIAIKYFPTFLRGSAKDWYLTDVRPEPVTRWELVKSLFINNYLGESDYQQLSQAIEAMRQRQGESVSNFIPRARRLMLLLTPDLPEREQVRQLKLKLRHEYNALLAFSNVKTLVELKTTCLRIEAGFHRNREGTDSRPRSRPPTRPVERGSSRPKNRPQPRSGYRPVKTVRPSPRVPTPKDKTCTRCERAGHLANECFAKRKKDGTVLLTSRKESPPQKDSNNRREVLNIASEWETNWGDPAPAKPSTSNGVITFCESPGKATNLVIGTKDELIKVPININGEIVEAVIDTGAYSTVIDSALAKKFGWEPTGPGPRLIGANRTELSVLGAFKAEIKLKLGSYVKLKHDQVVIVEGLSTPLLVGLELMNSLGLCIDITQKKVSFAKTTLPKGVSADKNENIPARSQALIPARVNYIGTIITSPIGDLQTANSISETKDGSLSLVVLNQDTKEISLKKGS